MYFIGIDLGTSSVKLLLMNEEGGIENIVTREYPLIFPKSGWTEQDPEEWIKGTLDGLRELTEGIDKSEIRGIGAGGQMHGLVVLDEDDKVIRPVILWIRNNEPENFARIKKIMLPKDYLNYRLTGSFCTEYSDASGLLLLDVKNRCWSKEMLDICGITEAQLPKLYESFEVVGTMKPEIADALGFPKDVKLVAGAGDNAAAAVGTGTVGDCMCNISLGTSGTMFISSTKFGVDKNNALHSFAHADGAYHLMGVTLSAASCNKWWCDEILHTKDYSKEQEEITKLGENQVFFLPYLLGERSPHNNTNVRGMFIGMSMDTTRAEMTQAVLEGVTFGLRDSMEVARSLGLDIKRTKMSGGGAKSPLWRKMVANIMNMDVDIVETEQGPGMGGAMLAMVGCGLFASVEEAAAKLVHVVDTVSPDPELVAKYEERYQFFKRLYPAILPLYPA